MEARRVTPLLLLDDVMSELDPERRERLVERLARGGQTLITAAAVDSVPARGEGDGRARCPPRRRGRRGRVRPR